MNRANTFNLIHNALRCASLSSRSTGQSRLNYTKHNRCRKARLNKTDIATNLLGRNFHITSQTPTLELTAIFRGGDDISRMSESRKTVQEGISVHKRPLAVNVALYRGLLM